MSSPSKELESIINRHLAPLVFEARVSSGDVEGIIEEAKTLLIEIEELIALREREARIEEWQRIYDHFENLDPRSKMPDVNNPRRSVLIELNELKKGEDL